MWYQHLSAQVLASVKKILEASRSWKTPTYQARAVDGGAPVEDQCVESGKLSMTELVKSWVWGNPDGSRYSDPGRNRQEHQSGAGIRTRKVVNRGVHGQYNPWQDAPIIERILIRTEQPELPPLGNGVVLGMADVVSDRDC